MMKKWVAVGVALMATSGVAAAGEITVLSGGAIEPGPHAAAAAFEKQTGHHVNITFNTTPLIQKRMAAGETFDVVIAPPAATDQLLKAGKVEGGGVDVGRVGLGAAVRPGAPAPDLSTPDTLKRSVLEAESIVFNRASTGLYFENLLRKMGIWGEVEPKTTRYADGASVMEHALKGKGKEIAFGAMTEILLYKEKGLRFVGPVPAAVQNYTSYVASPMVGGSNSALAREFVKHLGTPAGKKLFVVAGIE